MVELGGSRDADEGEREDDDDKEVGAEKGEGKEEEDVEEEEDAEEEDVDSMIIDHEDIEDVSMVDDCGPTTPSALSSIASEPAIFSSTPPCLEPLTSFLSASPDASPPRRSSDPKPRKITPLSSGVISVSPSPSQAPSATRPAPAPLNSTTSFRCSSSTALRTCTSHPQAYPNPIDRHPPRRV